MTYRIRAAAAALLLTVTLWSGDLPAQAKQAESDLEQIVDARDIYDIQVHATGCNVVLEKSKTENIEAVFTYPESLRTMLEDFRLVADRTNHMVVITTKYGEDIEEPSSDFRSDKGSQLTLTIRLPDKQYRNILLRLNGCHESSLNMNYRASKVIVSASGNVSMSSKQVYNKLTVSSQNGNFLLNLDQPSKEMALDLQSGRFDLVFRQNPTNIRCEIKNHYKYRSYGKYSVPGNWKATSSYGQDGDDKYERVIAQTGQATNTITVKNVNGAFHLQTAA